MIQKENRHGSVEGPWNDSKEVMNWDELCIIKKIFLDYPLPVFFLD